MKFNKTHLAVFAVLASMMSFVSCSDDNDNNANNNGNGIYLPSAIEWADEEGLYFTYDSNNRLIFKVEAEKGDDGIIYPDTTKFLYDNQGRLSSTVRGGNTVTFAYADNKVFCVDSSNGKTYSLDTLELGSKGELLREYGTGRSCTYEYDASGNIIKAEYNKGTSNASTEVMTYDNKNGVFKDVNLPQWYCVYDNFFPYNIINNLITFKENDDKEQKSIIDYNEAGYPVKIVNDGVYNITYIKR